MNRLDAMEAFVRVIEAGSFSEAARQLQIGQPAISKAIAQLEERLQVRLLIRSTHGLTATEAGENFYEHAKRALEETEEAERAARGAGAALSGRLRICAAVTFARLHIVPYMKDFLSEHPALDMEIILDDRNIDLIESGIDVGLRMGELTDSSLTARRIAQGQRIVVGTTSYFERNGEPRTPADLSVHQTILYDQRGGGGTWTFQKGDVQNTVALKGRLRISAAEGVREAVLADMGIAIASDWMFAPELSSARVKRVLPDWKLPPVDLWAVSPTGRQVSAKARAFISFVETRLAAAPASA